MNHAPKPAVNHPRFSRKQGCPYLTPESTTTWHDLLLSAHDWSNGAIPNWLNELEGPHRIVTSVHLTPLGRGQLYLLVSVAARTRPGAATPSDHVPCPSEERSDEK